ncbi:hypothetical protein B0A52_07151 [Exophiala mesophila]|uniref:Fanconi-associated nuclease n=1 Tax=Exophiala mesophila TaxID=212818 RepID=A0A438N0D5_EXOME|nr:hypothetical protein B0A52_07151 [Exophiala mesophila]
MPLEVKSPSIHNKLMGSRIPHPPSTSFYDDDNQSSNDFSTPPAKRAKTTAAASSNGPRSSKWASPAKALPSRRTLKNEISDSEDENDLRDGDGEQEIGHVQATQLETALPPIQSDQDAIEAYEAYKSGEYEQIVEHTKNPDGSPTTTRSRLESRSWVRGRSSLYVDAFNLALDTVLEDEGHLFNEAEMTLFSDWRLLDYEAQYLYVRLFLRKTSKWFRVKDLPYYSDVSNIDAAVLELQRDRPLSPVASEEEFHPGEAERPEGTTLGLTYAFAECSSEHITTLDEASGLLLLDELKTLAREVKVQGKNKTELLRNFRRTSGKQSGLGFKELKRTETDDSTGSVMSEDAKSVDEDEDESSGSRTPIANRDAHFTKKILDRTGRCIRLALSPLKLFERVHLVFYRSTEWTEKSLTTLILAKISRRTFPDYIVSRSATIFESRALLLEFEAGLRTQFKVDNFLEFNGTPSPLTLQEVRDIFEAVYPRWKALVRSEQEKEDRVYESGEGAYLRRFSPAWVYTRIVHKGLHPLGRFKEHLREHRVLTELLDQRLFHAARRGAWYQRKALLEEHYMHALVDANGRTVEANKKHWKRIALRTCEQGLQDKECHLIYHYDLQKRIKKLEKQLRLPMREQHDFGHVRLSKAVERTVVGIKIEKQQHQDTPVRRASLGRKDSVGTSSDNHNQKTNSTNTSAVNISTENAPERPVSTVPRLVPQTSTMGAKTIWVDEQDTNLPVSVEAMCLSHYRKIMGYKGYHCEGGILRTLFGLLFYDILFFEPYIPNVFQTPYQTCPLDLHTDSFYSSRVHEITRRVNEISNGDGLEIVRRVWNQHFEARTCIVGVRWDEFDRDDLFELIECWDPSALGTVMLVMAQEYQARGGGIPDLMLWKKFDDGDGQGNGDGNDDDHDNNNNDRNDNDNKNNDRNKYKAPQATATATANNTTAADLPQAKGEILFAEVKSANDRLSDTQRLWISVLLGAGVKVELCHAVAGSVRYE